MKFRTFIIFLAAIVLVLLLTAGVGAAWIIVNSPVSRLQSSMATDSAKADRAKNGIASPTTAIFVSRQAPFVASLRANPDRLLAVKLLTSLDYRQQIQDGFEQIQQALLPDAQLNYSRDIRPWLGDEVTIAIASDFDRDSSNGAQLGYLVAMTTADPALARRTLHDFWQRHSRAKNRISESYAGVEMVYRKPEKKGGLKETSLADAPTLASAVVGDRFVLLANSPKVLRDAIHNVQVAELNLENDSSYQQALDQLPQQAIGLAWVNLPQPLATAGNKAEISQSAAGLMASWSLELQGSKSQGLIANMRLLPVEGQSFPLNQATQSEPVGALRFAPAESAFVASGAHLQSQLETAWVGSGSTWIQRSLEALAQRQISLPEDATSWITGDYALAMLPRGNSTPDWVFVTQRSPETIAGLEKLDAIAQTQNITLGSFTLETPGGNQDIFVWTKFLTQPLKLSKTDAPKTSRPSVSNSAMSLTAEVQGVRTTIGDYEILATSLEAMNSAIQLSEGSLLSQSGFQEAIAALNQNNQGYLYLNQTALRKLVRPFSAQTATAQDSSLDRLLDRLQSLVFSSYGQTENGAMGAVSLQIKVAK